MLVLSTRIRIYIIKYPNWIQSPKTNISRFKEKKISEKTTCCFCRISSSDEKATGILVLLFFFELVVAIFISRCFFKNDTSFSLAFPAFWIRLFSFISPTVELERRSLSSTTCVSAVLQFSQVTQAKTTKLAPTSSFIFYHLPYFAFMIICITEYRLGTVYVYRPPMFLILTVHHTSRIIITGFSSNVI